MIIIMILKGKQIEFSSPNSNCVPLDRDIWLDDNNVAVKDYWQKKVNARLYTQTINTIIKANQKFYFIYRELQWSVRIH